jgi:hypothetical protein
MRKLFLCVAAAGTTLAVAAPANAQYYPQPYGYNGYGYRGYATNNGFQAVCSGQRGYALERRLRHELSEGEIDPYAAGRIHQAIDRAEEQQRQECAEGDWRSIARISARYDRIGQWLETTAHGYQPWDR